MASKKDEWHSIAEKELRGRSLEDLTWKTLEGIDIKPLYTEEDVAGLDHLGSIPGQAPFTPRTTCNDVCRSALDDPPIRRVFDRRGIQCLLPPQPGGRSAGRFRGLRPRHPPRL